jgi:hypothetical protein
VSMPCALLLVTAGGAGSYSNPKDDRGTSGYDIASRILADAWRPALGSSDGRLER